jgi:hypothetical protein
MNRVVLMSQEMLNNQQSYNRAGPYGIFNYPPDERRNWKSGKSMCGVKVAVALRIIKSSGYHPVNSHTFDSFVSSCYSHLSVLIVLVYYDH